MRAAVIDVGTNSVKFCIGERGPDGALETIVDRAEVTRLGEGLADSGELGQGPIERTAAAIDAMVEQARAAGAQQIAAVATAGKGGAPHPPAPVDGGRPRSGG